MAWFNPALASRLAPPFPCPSRTLQALKRLFGANVAFKQGGKKALGFGGANHEAIVAASGSHFVLINTDMYVTPGWLAALLYGLKALPHAGMVGPMYIGDGNKITEAGECGTISDSSEDTSYRSRQIPPGGVVYSDSAAGNYGRNFEPSHEVRSWSRMAEAVPISLRRSDRPRSTCTPVAPTTSRRPVCSCPAPSTLTSAPSTTATRWDTMRSGGGTGTQ